MYCINSFRHPLTSTTFLYCTSQHSYPYHLTLFTTNSLFTPSSPSSHTHTHTPHTRTPTSTSTLTHTHPRSPTHPHSHSHTHTHSNSSHTPPHTHTFLVDDRDASEEEEEEETPPMTGTLWYHPDGDSLSRLRAMGAFSYASAQGTYDTYVQY